MALIWKSIIDGNHYEVRTAGASVRLYRNGVNHSQINPNRPLSGSIWDLITLPALHRSMGSIGNACILGFGAGAVGRQLKDLNIAKQIVGVELDPIHLSIANGFFGCEEGYELISGNAVDWVSSHCKNLRFDVIIDDLFAEHNGVPVRCVPMDVSWCQSLSKLLKPKGMLIFNIIEPEKIRHLPIFTCKELSMRFTEIVMYRIDGYENRIIAFSESPFVESELNTNLQRIYKSYPACRGVKKRYIKCKL